MLKLVFKLLSIAYSYIFTYFIHSYVIISYKNRLDSNFDLQCEHRTRDVLSTIS
jgi:hypothetical protein